MAESTTKLTFFDLPREIRDKIYLHCVASEYQVPDLQGHDRDAELNDDAELIQVYANRARHSSSRTDANLSRNAEITNAILSDYATVKERAGCHADDSDPMRILQFVKMIKPKLASLKQVLLNNQRHYTGLWCSEPKKPWLQAHRGEQHILQLSKAITAEAEETFLDDNKIKLFFVSHESDRLDYDGRSSVPTKEFAKRIKSVELKLDVSNYRDNEEESGMGDRCVVNAFLREHVHTLIGAFSGLETQRNTCRIDLGDEAADSSSDGLGTGSSLVEAIGTLVGFREVVVGIRAIEVIREQEFEMREECSKDVSDLLMDELGPGETSCEEDVHFVTFHPLEMLKA